MSPIKRILVAVKTVDRPSAAVVKATQIARATGASIELFHCVDAGLTVQELATYKNGIDEFEAGQRRVWEEGLERLATQIRSHGVHVSTSAPVDHPIHEGIVRQGRRVQADLIVTDAHVGSNFAPSLLQEVDWELVRLSTVPVLIARNPEPYQHPLVLAALDPCQKHSKPTTLDGKILDMAESFTSLLQGDLHAMHAYSLPAVYVEASAASSANVAIELQAIDAQNAQAALDAALRASSIPPQRRHVLPGSPADAIIQAATDLKASLLVMGSVGRSGLGGLLVGNTAEKALNRIPCDLLLLKPDGFENAIPDKRRGARLVATGAYY
jgi:universal stress protein E